MNDEHQSIRKNDVARSSSDFKVINTTKPKEEQESLKRQQFLMFDRDSSQDEESSF